MYVGFVHSVHHSAQTPRLRPMHFRQLTVTVPLGVNPFKRTVSPISASIRENIGVREHVPRYVVPCHTCCWSIIRIFVEFAAHRR